MFLKLQRLLSQQAVLIKTMFHLFLMIINCPCNEKKKKERKFSARKIIPPCGQADSSQIGTCAHFSGIWKILPLAGHPFFYSSSSRMLVLNAVTHCKFPKAWPSCHCPGTANPAGKDGFPAWGKKKCRDFQKRCSCLCPLVPPSCHLS